MMRWLAFVLCSSAFAGVPPNQGEEFFETKIRPILANKCFACHTNSKLGGLRLDTRESILQGGKSGAAIVAGDPDGSLLIQAVSRKHERLKMPPTGPLDPAEVADLAAWVKMGAVWPEKAESAARRTSGEYVITKEQRAFWAFQPIQKPEEPAVKNTGWAKGVVDRFVLSKLEQKGLQPVEAASKTALIRRATFDLTGLPPTPDEVDAFLSDQSAEAFAKIVDRLLGSQRYGERWGRYWLDLARYADGRLGASRDTPYENAFRYRDWVIAAFNRDLPYNRMIEAQIAADHLLTPGKDQLLAGLGFQALGIDANERLDVTTKTFLGLTVGCAQCHNHKFDPIPTKDYYSLYGVFASTSGDEIPLTGANEVAAYKKAKKAIDDLEEKIDDFIRKHSVELQEILAQDTSRYLMAAWGKLSGAEVSMAGLDSEVLDRWVAYLKGPKKDHAFLKPWDEMVERGAASVNREELQRFAAQFGALTLSIFANKNEIDDRNYVKLGGAKGAKDERTRQYTNLESLDIEKYYLWRDLASDPFQRNGVYFPGGVYYYGVTNAMRRDFEIRGGAVPVVKDIDRFLSGPWKAHLDRMRAELQVLKKALPPQYPFLHAVKDSDKPANARVHIRGDEKNLGNEAPRRFLSILCDGEPAPFTKGSGRLELAEAIVKHPLAARVMVNRVWQWHFGQGIVRSSSNFGQLGDRPTHPELLEYLSARFIESGWSLKALHREIMLSSTYQLSTKYSEPNAEADPENRLLWRANLKQRLDAESIRDSMLFVAGRLSPSTGGAPDPFDDRNNRRTVYGYVSRTTLDGMLALFDFPNPNNTSEQRSVTLGPMQRLYFMNNEFVAHQAEAFADRLSQAASDDRARIRQAYRLALGRQPTDQEIQMGKDFLSEPGGSWPQYAQVLLTSAEFVSVP
jgi:hypothetical protein